jgi:FkbM family methyltransferase
MYSQNKEDEFVLDFFSRIESPKKSVLDIGANDGKTFSNSLLLIENGWEAHLVEPSSTYKKLMDLHHANNNVFIYPIGIAESNGELDFYESGSFDGEDGNLVSCIQPKEMDRWKNVIEFKPTKALFQTFDTFLKTNKLEHQCFDFISIDVEGHDWIVLNQIDLILHKTKMVCVEWNSIEKNALDFSNYCGTYNFKEVHRNAENIIFANTIFL